MGSLRCHLILAASVVAVLVLQGPGVVDAQPGQKKQDPSDVDKQTARKLVDAGIAAQDANEYDTAIKLYNKAFALVPHPLLLFNIGQAHRVAGRLDRAAPFYERYLALDPEGAESDATRTFLAAFYFKRALSQRDLGQEVEARASLEQALRHGETPLGAEQFKEAQEQLQELERRLGRIRVTCQTQGAEVTLDGVRLFIGPGSYQGWIKAKDHELTIKKVGHLSQSKRVAIFAGNLQHFELSLATLSEPVGFNRRWSAWKPWAVVAVGGVVMTASGMLHALAARNFKFYDQLFLQLDCAVITSGCEAWDIPPQLNARLATARRQQMLAMGGYIAGGSLIAAGAALVYLNRPSAPDRRTTYTRGVAVIPALSNNLLGFVMNVEF